MKVISLKIEDAIFGETKKILSKMKKSRNRYSSEAIEYYKQLQERLIIDGLQSSTINEWMEKIHNKTLMPAAIKVDGSASKH